MVCSGVALLKCAKSMPAARVTSTNQGRPGAGPSSAGGSAGRPGKARWKASAAAPAATRSAAATPSHLTRPSAALVPVTWSPGRRQPPVLGRPVGLALLLVIEGEHPVGRGVAGVLRQDLPQQ